MGSIEGERGEPSGRAVAISPVLRLNMSGQSVDPAVEADRWQAAIEMAEYVDRGGFAIVNVEEHHDSEIGWMPSPLIMAGLVIGRTKRVQVRASALLVTLYDPVRLAEDIAILDLASRGRFVFIAGQGYRPSEYHMLDRDWGARGAATEHFLDTVLKAWRGEPFDYRGQVIHVSPRPYTRPHPPFFYGGMSKVAVKRAARYGIPFFPAQPMPELEALYHEECARHGTKGRVVTHKDMTLLLIDQDPDRAWAELGRYLLTETRQYSSWRKNRVERHYQSDGESIEALRAQGIFEILTPDEALARALAATEEYKPILHPLAGGIPVARAWNSVELYVEKVLKRLPQAGAAVH